MSLPRKSLYIMFAALILSLLLATVNASQATPIPHSTTKSVQKNQQQTLVLKTYPAGLPIPDSIDRGIVASYRKGRISVADLFVENLDLTRNPSKEHRSNLGNLLRHKMADKNIGIVMVEGEPAVNFLATEAEGLFPNAAIITLTSPNIEPLEGDPRKVMDIPWRVDVAGTLRVALDLFPKTRKVMVVTSANERVLPFLDGAKKALAPWQGKIDFEYTNKMTYEQMMQRISTLPPDAIVLYSPFFNDTSGRSFVPAEVVVDVCKAALVPVFATLAEYLGHGIVGGSLLQTEMIGKQAGDLAIAYMNGSLKLEEPVTTFVTPTQMMFDWRELARWKADLDRLPKNSTIINRPSSLWNDYRNYVIVALTLIALQAGMILALLAMHRRRKFAEEETRRQKYLFETMFNTIPDAVVVTNTRREIKIANKGVESTFGYKPEELLHKTTQILYADQYKFRYAGNNLFYKDAEKRKDFYITYYKDKSGKEFPGETLGAKLFDDKGEWIGNLGIMRDVTESKKAEEALRSSEQSYRELFDSVNDLVYTQDLQGRFLSLNPALARIMGYEPEELVGVKTSQLMEPKLRELFDRDYLGTLKREGNHQGTTKYIAKGGGARYIEHNSSLVTAAEGEKYISGIGRDVTERIKAQKQMEALQEQLRHAQKMEAVGTLAGGIAHDFNNILAAIMGYTEIALEEQEEGKPTQNELRGILQSTNRAKKLVQQILTFSRRADTQLKLVDVNHELLVAANLLKQALPKMIDIRLELSEEIAPVMGDPYQIEQILMNLGANSRDAMPDGGTLIIAISQQTVSGLICRACAQPFAGDYVVITVTDTGEGMKKEDLERIFEPFFTTKEVGKGTGLGLATIFGTVRSHGGHITCTSELGKGTTFTIYLPPAEGEVEDVANVEPEEAIEGGQETILLVDDEAHILDIGAQNLSRAGYEVITAPNGEAALEVFKGMRDEIALVILDLSMPGMGGHKCLQELLSLAPDLKIIVSTGYSRDGDLSETMSSGAEALLSKPFSKNEMLKTVRMVLDA
ncbi:MAG: PAS domain S-box protein [Desulfarculaceae bacterium]|nr:PAS domain S-box protein [Desulfarculaceae bacterium]MCF8072958.1 PAS domain S-box protein [Desulfarculaceae bacterium]MCF8100746.1 PAS domain S-box protein [Desulfarculaceae bacterium]MCF8115484.1 PAS domain S-box protein [Desulfarculaceae bacterium]